MVRNEAVELETMIIFNRADSRDGNFKVYTSIKLHYKKLLERVGKQNVISVQEFSEKTRTVGWIITLPIECYSSRTFGIKNTAKRYILEGK